MTRAKPSREALEAWLRKGSAYAAGRILMAIRAMDTADVSGNEQALLIEIALDCVQAEEREVLAATLLKVAASDFLEYSDRALQVTHEAKCVLKAIATELCSGEPS